MGVAAGIATAVFATGAALAVAVTVALRRRNALHWFPSYVAGLRRRPAASSGGPVHVMFCFVDHFEPQWRRPDYATEVARVERWCREYRALAARHRDADGCAPKHTFFYPEEEYRPEHLDALAALCAEGLGEIEVHLHHDGDTSAGLREKLERFTRTLRERHGALADAPLPASGPASALGPRPVSEPAFGAAPGAAPGTGLAWAFIHGNWALDNSDPTGRWCGVNDELRVLAEAGCYADFTLPSAPSPTQTRKINSIYYATDDPKRPKSHDDGTDVRVGGASSGDLMIVQGVLGWDWRSRKWGVIPRIENSDVRAAQPPRRERVDYWVRTGVHVRGRPEWVFVKIHTHGAQETDMPALLGDPADEMHAYLEERYNDGADYVLHYVSAREMFNIIKAAEAGENGDPGLFRDYVLAPPPHCRAVDTSAATRGPS